MEWIATWEPQPKRGPFAGFWSVRPYPDGQMVCCSESVVWSKTREGIKSLLDGRGDCHPRKFLDC